MRLLVAALLLGACVASVTVVRELEHEDEHGHEEAGHEPEHDDPIHRLLER